MTRLPMEKILERLEYFPSTGQFIWKVSLKGAKPGQVAGYIDASGYVMIKIDQKKYSAARMAWAISYGAEVPAGMQIDHIDRCRSNNAIKNLRVVTPRDNCRNRGGLFEVGKSRNYTRHKQTGKYQVEIDGKYLGLYETPELAMAAVETHRRHSMKFQERSAP